MDHDTVTAHDAIGKVGSDFNSSFPQQICNIILPTQDFQGEQVKVFDLSAQQWNENDWNTGMIHWI